MGLVLTLATSGCDSDDDVDAATEADATGSEPSDDGSGGGGEGTITITVDDGTVYELVDVTSCDTSFTDPSGFPLSNGYDLTGRTADGSVSLTTTRAGLDDDSAVFAGGVEGDFDHDGRNPRMLYRLEGDGLDLTVDGPNVTGTIGGSAVAPTRPHGDTTSFTIDARCN